MTMIYRFTILVFLIIWQNVQSTGQEQPYSSEEIAAEDKYMESFIPSVYGEQEEAIQSLSNYTKNNPNSAAAFFYLGKLLNESGEQKKALSHIQKAGRLDRTNKWYKIYEAALLEDLERYAEAATIFEDLRTKYPDEKSYAMNQAFATLRSGNPDRAIGILSEIEMEIGVSEEVSRKKIFIYKALSMDEKVISEYESLIETFPDEEEYYIELADYYNGRNDISKARRYYNAALEVNPSNSSAKYALINLQSDSGTKIESTNQEINEALSDIDISLDKKLRMLVPKLQELVISDEEKVETLISQQRILIDNYPESAKAHAFAGDVYYYSGRIEEAVKSYESSLENTKSVYSVWQKYIYSLFMLKKYEKMRDVTNSALIYFPNKAEVYFYNAYAQHVLGNSSQAVSMLGNAAMISGRDVLIKQEIKALKLLADYDSEQYTSVMNEFENTDYISPLALRLLAETAKNNNKDLDEVMEIADSKLINYPNKDQAFYTIAYINYLRTDYKSALSNIEKSIKNGGLANPEILELRKRIKSNIE